MPDSHEMNRWNQLAGGEDIHVLRAVMEDGTAAAAGVFRSSPINPEEVFLLHIYVRKELRGSGMTRRLLRYAEEYFSALGANCLRVRCCGNVEKLEGIYDLLLKEAFLPLVVQGSVMRYSLSDWLRSDFMSKVGLMGKYMESVHTIESWDDPRLQDFLAGGFSLPRRCFDPQLCRFYIVDGQIQAALCAECAEEGLLFFHSLFFGEHCQRQVAFVGMLASLMKGVEQLMSGAAAVVVQSNLASVRRGLIQQFGSPEEEYLSQEYCCRFGRHMVTDWLAEGAGLRFEAVKAEETGEAVGEELLPLYDGVDRRTAVCLRRPTAMTRDPLWRKRSELVREEDLWSWRRELNLWLEQMGREPFDMEKVLPFEAFLSMEELPSAAGKPVEDGTSTSGISTDEVRYSVLTRGAKAFASVLPSHLRSRCLQGELVVMVGSTPEGVVLSFAVFSQQKLPQKTVFLDYIHVAPGQRRKGLGLGLLAHAQEAFVGYGLRGITTRHATEAAEAGKIHHFLKRAGFRPVSMRSTVEAYFVQSLHDTVIMGMTEEEKKRLPRVETIGDRNDYRLKQLVWDSRKRGFYFDRMRYDQRYSFFHVKDGVIRAAVITERMGEQALACREMWFAPGYDTAYMRAALLSAVPEAAKKYMREDAVVTFQFGRGWKMDKVRALLGESEISRSLCEYVLPFQREKAREGESAC